jgi:hypothetical protein
MMNEVVISVSTAIIVGCMAIMTKHIMNTDKHPDRNELMPRSECDTRHKGLEDCMEGKITALHDKVDTFREDVKTGFEDVKDLIRNK